ncbi:hypothetical protein GJ698_02475 [Pseudoduganella sp. FT26W]|uniref:Uncharacterized protein n=1 Tax=Duganella aquatilis TaxID=2666082 RepID=A0A844CZL1_9BURK|nr:hypothetical protein [Duganella aquatilis]MRW82955.1 hypothetical protein [Duganella aquatilis]
MSAQNAFQMRHALLSLVAPAEPTNAEVLRAVEALDVKVDQLLTTLVPQQSPLTLDPAEIARTMAQLKRARPISKETPP